MRLLFLAIAFLCCQLSHGKIIIRGKINDYDGKTVVYYRPTLEGIFTPYWFEIKPTGNGTFKIEFENEGYGNTTVSYKKVRYRFFHDSNSEISVELNDIDMRTRRRIPGNEIFLFCDSLKQAATVSIRGDHEAINKFYNRNLRSTYYTTRMVDGNYYSDLIAKTANPASAMYSLDSLKQREIDQIDQLPIGLNAENPAPDILEKEIRSFLKNEVNTFYGSIFLNAMFLKRTDQIVATRIDSTKNHNYYNRDWELLIERFINEAKTNSKSVANSADYLDFMGSLIYTIENYRRYEFPQNPAKSLDEMAADKMVNYNTTLFPDAKTRFAHELDEMHVHVNNQLFYSPALLHSIYAIQAKRGPSAHFDYFKPKVEKLRTYLETSKEDFRGAKIIHANYSTFQSLVKRFEGKPLLIDIWATWCHPCVDEFKYKGIVQPFIDADEIEILYISIDKQVWQDRWRQSIKINELQGNHFRADEEFIKDMWNVIGDFEGSIPRYVLIDKYGKLFKSTAARPSAGDALTKELEAIVAASQQ